MRAGQRNRELACVAALVLIDLLSFCGALSLACASGRLLNIFFAGAVAPDFSFCYYFRFWWMPLIFIITVAYEKLYIKRLSLRDETREIIRAVTVSVTVIFAIVSLGKLGNVISTSVIVLLWLFSIPVFPFLRLLGKKNLPSIGLWKENAIIIGAGAAGTEIARGIMQEAHMGYRIVGFLDDAKEKKGMEICVDNTKFKVFGNVRHLRKFVNLLNVSTVIIAVPSLSLEKMSEITSAVQRCTRNVLIVPDLKGMTLLNTRLYHLFMQELFLLEINNNLKSLFNRYTGHRN